MSDLHPVVQLGVTLAGLWILATLLAQHLQRTLLIFTRSAVFATRSYDLLLFPGIVFHELAHVIFAVLLRVPVLQVNLFQLRRNGDPRQGEVVVARADPLRMSLIGAAPLLVGIPVILWLLRVVDVPALGVSIASLEALRPIVREPLRVLGLYIIWAIANAMFPSAADRAAWRVIGIFVAAIVAIIFLSGQSIEIPQQYVAVANDMAARLAAGLLPVLIGDAILLVLVVLLEHTGRSIRRC